MWLWTFHPHACNIANMPPFSKIRTHWSHRPFTVVRCLNDGFWCRHLWSRWRCVHIRGLIDKSVAWGARRWVSCLRAVISLCYVWIQHLTSSPGCKQGLPPLARPTCPRGRPWVSLEREAADDGTKADVTFSNGVDLQFSVTRNRNTTKVINSKLSAESFKALNCTCIYWELCNSSPSILGHKLINHPLCESVTASQTDYESDVCDQNDRAGLECICHFSSVDIKLEIWLVNSFLKNIYFAKADDTNA